MNFAFIHAEKPRFPLAALCRIDQRNDRDRLGIRGSDASPRDGAAPFNSDHPP